MGSITLKNRTAITIVLLSAIAKHNNKTICPLVRDSSRISYIKAQKMFHLSNLMQLCNSAGFGPFCCNFYIYFPSPWPSNLVERHPALISNHGQPAFATRLHQLWRRLAQIQLTWAKLQLSVRKHEELSQSPTLPPIRLSAQHAYPAASHPSLEAPPVLPFKSSVGPGLAGTPGSSSSHQPRQRAVWLPQLPPD